MIKAGSLPERMGFRSGKESAHQARSMMIDEVSTLLSSVPPDAPAADYREAVIDANLLGKKTNSNRHLSFRHLQKLYALDSNVPLFKAMRRLWSLDQDSQPLLALQICMARDPLLRESAPLIMMLTPGQRMGREEMERFVSARSPHYSPRSVRSFAQNLNGTWTQAGFLAGKVAKRRSLPKVGLANVVFALFTARVDGYNGEAMLGTQWVRLLPIDKDTLLRMGEGASRSGHFQLLRAGGVIEVRFQGYLAPDEEALLNG
jgi:hypothetical protein